MADDGAAQPDASVDVQPFQPGQHFIHRLHVDQRERLLGCKRQMRRRLRCGAFDRMPSLVQAHMEGLHGAEQPG
ncbi:hypothetical protein D3C72_1965260 [compost metagenome]